MLFVILDDVLIIEILDVAASCLQVGVTHELLNVQHITACPDGHFGKRPAQGVNLITTGGCGQIIMMSSTKPVPSVICPAGLPDWACV